MTVLSGYSKSIIRLTIKASRRASMGYWGFEFRALADTLDYHNPLFCRFLFCRFLF